MAIYHLTTKVFSRGKGQSAIAAAAYRSGQRLVDEAVGEQKFYNSRANRIQFEGMFVPTSAPDWAHDRNAFWNRAEKTETRKDGRLAREIEVSLPHELTDQQRLNLVKDFVREALVRKGYAADVAIHAPDRQSDDRNHHAHILISERKLSADGFAAKKDPAMNSKVQLGEWREQWAHLANRHLERYGHEARVDHRSLKEQGIEREATTHIGYAAAEMTRRGAQSDRVDDLNSILARNQEHGELRREMSAINQELASLEQEPTPKPAQAAPPQPSDTLSPEERAYRQEIQLKMEAALRSDSKALYEPAAKAFGEGARDAASKIGQEARTERREEVFWAKQEEWYASRRLPPAEPAAPAPKKSIGLQVVDRATGAVSSLADFISGVASEARPEHRANMRAFVTDPEVRKQQQLSRLVAFENEREAAVAVERIARDLEQGKNLNAQDVRKLTHQHQDQIRTFGDTAVQQIVDEARKRSESYWKGNERERER